MKNVKIIEKYNKILAMIKKVFTKSDDIFILIVKDKENKFSTYDYQGDCLSLIGSLEFVKSKIIEDFNESIKDRNANNNTAN